MKKIIIVDDMVNSRSALTDVLTYAGFNVIGDFSDPLN